MSPTTVNEAFPRAQTALASSPLYALRELELSTDGETLLISGKVTSYYHKQLAQEVVRAVSGSVALRNSVAVDWDLRPVDD